MYNKKSIISGFQIALFLSVMCLTACSTKTASDVTEEEKKEIIELEESAKEIDDSVEELDSALQELNDIKNLLR